MHISCHSQSAQKTDLKMLIKLIKINKKEKRGKLSTGQVFAVLACQLHINN